MWIYTIYKAAKFAVRTYNNNMYARVSMYVVVMVVARSPFIVLRCVIISRFELVQIIMHSLNILSSLLMIGLLCVCDCTCNATNVCLKIKLKYTHGPNSNKFEHFVGVCFFSFS